MTASSTEERRNQLVQILMREGTIRVGEAARQFHVSTETIRKDIIYLEQEGIAIKSHGGAAIAADMMELSVNLKRGQNKDAKERIAAEAMKYVKEGDSILIDSGTTSGELARFLSFKKGLSIFTNSLLVMNALVQSENQVFCFGGSLDHASYSMLGGWVNEELRRIHVDLCFLGTDGFLGNNGPSTQIIQEADLKRAMVLASDRTIILTDSSKFSRKTMFEFCPWTKVEALITDREAPDKEVEKLKEKTKVITV